MDDNFPLPGTLLISKISVPIYVVVPTTGIVNGEKVESAVWATPWSDEKRVLEVGEPILFLGAFSFVAYWEFSEGVTSSSPMYGWKILVDDKVAAVEISETPRKRDLFDLIFEIYDAKSEV